MTVTSRPVVTVAVEGLVDEATLTRVLAAVGLDVGPVHGRRGKGYLDERLGGFNNAAHHAPWVVLRDLDHDAPCAPELIDQLLPIPATWMRLRIAVREVEAWLLADREKFAEYFSVPLTAVPTDPDMLEHPKQAFVGAMRKSRSGEVRTDMVPADDDAQVGPGYTARMIAYATTRWRPREAQRWSPSLKRAMKRLQSLARALKEAGIA